MEVALVRQALRPGAQLALTLAAERVLGLVWIRLALVTRRRSAVRDNPRLDLVAGLGSRAHPDQRKRGLQIVGRELVRRLADALRLVEGPEIARLDVRLNHLLGLVLPAE